MRRTSGSHAITAAVGAGFWPDGSEDWPFGEQRDDGNRAVRMDHPDGRQVTFLVGDDDGWQHGDLVSAEAIGDEWKVCADNRTARTLPEFRAMLAEHEPDRECAYNGAQAIPQARDLDGRERDILVRIIRDLRDAWTEPTRREGLRRLIHLEGAELLRLVEVAAVLDPRDE